MSAHIIPYRSEHLLALALQPAQAYLGQYVSPETADALDGPLSYALVDGADVHACGGLVEHWPTRATAWSMLAPSVGRYMVEVTRYTRRLFLASPYLRIEAQVDCGHSAGHRWARLLGMVMEASCMRAYRPDGGDCALYAWVRA